MKPSRLRTFLLLAALTVLGVPGCRGIIRGAEEGGVYLAAIQHDLNPRLFHADSDFFALQLQATQFDKIVAGSVRLTHLPVSVVTLAWHLLAIFAILAACYRIASRCFEQEYARWCGVALVAVFFTLPVAGSALYLVDQNLHPRAMATALMLFAVDFLLARRYVAGFALAAAAFLLHPLMAAFGMSLCVFLAIPGPAIPWAGWGERRAMPGTMPMVLAFALPMGWLLEPTSPAWRAAAGGRNCYFLTRWAWYEWLGAIAPMFILLWFARMARRRERPVLERLAARTAVYGFFQLAVALVIALPPALERMRPMQPMRYLHLIYVVMILLGGCFVGEHFLRGVRWRWAALFVPAALGMFVVQRALYPGSPHLELPGIHSSNPWLESFRWIRENTPEDAYFVLGPEYLRRPGEDYHGFRALALRSVLADTVKDASVVTQVPRLGERWQRETEAQNDWDQVSADGLRKLKSEFGVDWVILERPKELGLECTYRNERLEVCRIE